ncbi:hypothetical protein ACFLSG_04345, partial [Candidatus Bipolaricaulota bacterium]
MNRRLGVLVAIVIAVVTLFTFSAFATDAQMYFSSDKNGQNRVTNVQEGDEIWIVVIDNDENIDCDVRDKIWTDVKIMDPKTGAYIVWKSYWDGAGDANDTRYFESGYVPYKGHWPGSTAGWLGEDYLEETGADTGVFTSKRAFQVGSREDFDDPTKHAHVVDVPIQGTQPGVVGETTWTDDFQWGNYIYLDEKGDGNADNRASISVGGAGLSLDDPPPLVSRGAPVDSPSEWVSQAPPDGEYIIGRFENMDTLIGMYQDPNDPTDVATGMMKIIDTEATISWNQEIYKDANGSASITVVDPDENLNCNEVEWVPVFILVNPGSWNVDGSIAANSFCGLLQDGGYDSADNNYFAGDAPSPIRWYNIYEERYIKYPVAVIGDVVAFDAADENGYVKVTFYAQETGVSTGVFQLNLNSILTDLEFNSLNVRDVLVAYYLDPNDADDFKLATAYIEEKQHSITSFTDENRAAKDLYWIGRDPVYVQVIDANANVDPCCPEQIVVHICDPHGEDDSEWLILDETSSNSPVFFTFAGTQLWPVWDALGVGVAGSNGGFQLQVDNWKIEAFNEDDIYARYNDVYYGADLAGTSSGQDFSGIGDANDGTSFPPRITRVRVPNDVSFDLMSVADTQVYDGSSTNMWFLDRQGNRVSGYVNSDCVFIEVLDPDQDEDQYRRERIDAYWDGGQNVPFGPQALNEFVCDFEPTCEHYVNALLGDTNIFNDIPADSLWGECTEGIHDGSAGWAKVYVLNPRN